VTSGTATRTNAISDERFRSRALAALEPHFTPDLRDETSAKFIEAVSSISRQSALVSVRNLAGTTFDSGGHSAIIAMFHAIKDVSCWYP
jgi:hypothetical protein